MLLIVDLTDVTVYHRGFHGDLNGTYPVGSKAEADESSMHLIKTARECLDAAIAICGPGVAFGEIGKVIQPLAEEKGCAVVRNLTGHGIGRVFHCAPTIYHHKTRKVSVVPLNHEANMSCLQIFTRRLGQCK
jgi:methionyl aminopeptidase